MSPDICPRRRPFNALPIIYLYSHSILSIPAFSV
jgi:hypothetical protein